MSSLGKRRAAALKQDDLAYTARRREIIDCAALLFRNKGYAASTFKDIAEKLNTDRATIYYYFASKRDLLLDVVRDAVVSVSGSAQQISKSKDKPPVKLHNIIVSLLNSYASNYPHQFVYIQEGMAVNKEQDKHLHKLGKLYERSIAEIIEEGMADGSFRNDKDPKVILFGLLGALNWTNRWMDPGGRMSPEEIATTFSALFLDGLLPRTDAPIRKKQKSTERKR
jgi:AcrR family transcriptional regulator